ncbi:hypothetical protein, partial [uncultured Veillonella sp.]|uniref:hypothetical protein n=1 Tax=uncultured Veillonella sp. TaxID=159268 RepID=UPI00261A1FE7
MLRINVYEGIKTKLKVYNALRQNKEPYVTQDILGRNKEINIDKEVSVNREQSLTHEGGFLYLDALGGTTIISIVLLAVVTMIGSLCLEYRQARMEEAALQVA